MTGPASLSGPWCATRRDWACLDVDTQAAACRSHCPALDACRQLGIAEYRAQARVSDCSGLDVWGGLTPDELTELTRLKTGYLPADDTQATLARLLNAGWPRSTLAAFAGCSPKTIQQIAAGLQPSVRLELVEAITRLGPILAGPPPSPIIDLVQAAIADGTDQIDDIAHTIGISRSALRQRLHRAGPEGHRLWGHLRGTERTAA